MKTSRISFAERQPRASSRIGSPRSAGPRRGFTLVELLVVIAIIVMLMDVDQKNPYGVGSQTVAAAPVHGSFRNALYFDGHVQPISIKP